MITAAAINSTLNIIFLALTPIQRYEAARRFNTSIIANKWFIIVGVIAITILTILLLIVSVKRFRHERKTSDQLFAEYSQKRGLSAREHQLLIDIAKKAGLKRNESIFTLVSAFDRGSAKVQDGLKNKLSSDEHKQLNMEISFLREKLGFRKQAASSIGQAKKPDKLSSRQIPTGKQVHITRQKTGKAAEIESTVTKNNDTELTVELKEPVEFTINESLCVRYYFGPSIWEFDSSVISCDGSILVLDHNDNIRFINRRRFLRVSVKKTAYIAHFPFTKTISKSRDSAKGTPTKADNIKTSSSIERALPEFFPAVITELSGTGLRIESSLQVETGERIIVVFSLDKEQQGNATPADEGNNATTSKVVEDIGIVRDIKAIQDGFSTAVELTGLSDPDVDELISAANAESVRAGAENQNVPATATVEKQDS